MEYPLSNPEDPEIRALHSKGSGLVARATALARAVKDQPTLQSAADFLNAIKAFRDRIAAVFGPVRKAAYEAWKGICEIEGTINLPPVRAEAIIRSAISEYAYKEERERRTKQLKLEADARRKAEDAKIKQAARLEQAGDKEQAEAILDEPVTVAPVVLPSASRASGIATRDEWYAEVIDMKALVKAMAEGRAPLHLLEADAAALKGFARSSKGTLPVPGVRVWSEKVVAATGGREVA